MESVYIIFVVVLAVIAISDLIVGVTNDAVNFLNSAIGSKAFSFKIIMLIAALGIVFGATFSSGMMEVARSGIFHPQHFYFSEIMILFLAVMIADVLLLDLFNTFGMPTSTTVSIVFELLGAAVGLSLIKIFTHTDPLTLTEYINYEKAFTIIFGILLSVVIAFTFGAFFQYISRLIFSFDYKKPMKRFGALWSSFAVVSITYFILVKGAKGASFITANMASYIENNTFLIIGYSFVFWFIVFQLIAWLTNFNIFKIVVLFGTFALAMAFAGNDLVNFIGVPLAGYESYRLWIASGEAAEIFMMSGLAGKVSTPTYLLLLAGLIMAVTLYLSRKARSVTDTEVSLGRQEEGYERFGSSTLSRTVVRASVKFGKSINRALPVFYKRYSGKRFDRTVFAAEQEALGINAPSFDLVRASVILAVASIIISFATTLKLPLSTTYVTFMVAMGASLADGAWGRETAVYRVTGVFSVIGGWFLTAFLAFSASFIFVVLFYFGSYVAVFVMVAIAAYIVYRTHAFHDKKAGEKAEKLKEQAEEEKQKVFGVKEVRHKNLKNFNKFIEDISEILKSSIKGLEKEDLKTLVKNFKKYERLQKESLEKHNEINKVIKKIPESDIDLINYYTINLYFLREIIQSLRNVAWDTFYHVDNNHKPLIKDQIEELEEAADHIINYLKLYIELIKDNLPENLDQIHGSIIDYFNELRSRQAKRVKKKTVGNRNSMLYFAILGHLRSMLNFTKRLVNTELNFNRRKDNIL